MRGINVTEKVKRVGLPVILVALAGALVGCGGKGDPVVTTNTSAPAAQSSPDPKIPSGGGSVPTARTAPPKTPAADPGNDVKMKVEITKGELSINGSRLALPVELSAIEKAFGKPSRTSDSGALRSLYWKELGINCLQDKYGEKNVVTVGFHFSSYYGVDTNERGQPFSGTILLEQESVTKDTNVSELSKRIDSLKKRKGFDFDWEIRQKDSATVYVKEGISGTGEVVVEKLSK